MEYVFCTGLKAYLFVEEILMGITIYHIVFRHRSLQADQVHSSLSRLRSPSSSRQAFGPRVFKQVHDVYSSPFLPISSVPVISEVSAPFRGDVLAMDLGERRFCYVGAGQIAHFLRDIGFGKDGNISTTTLLGQL